MKILGIDNGTGYVDAGSNMLQVDGMSLKFDKTMEGCTISVSGFPSTVKIEEVINTRQVILSSPAQFTIEGSSVIVYGEDDRQHKHDTIVVTSPTDLEKYTKPETVALTSKCLSSATWNPEKQTVTIDFKDGKSEVYKTMPKEVFDRLVGAPSVGNFYNKSVRGKFA